MKEIKIFPRKHICGKKFDMRIMDTKDDNGNSSAWIIYGICKNCNVIMISSMFLQAEKPVQGIDFIIDDSKKSGKGKEWK
ncbi:MAG: hypothetical protein KKA65_03695 [Nanoarchaeota archaeon]|nr:hypothetical protein [Nanoarchaeota archaeon]MBU4284284.1 hypothetical protein [Nanoarchaeota archaeon]MBU4456581.1 hypothetical protein [Nanoarchaeota archaeon]